MKLRMRANPHFVVCLHAHTLGRWLDPTTLFKIRVEMRLVLLHPCENGERIVA